MGLLFSHRRVPSCRRHAFRAEKEVGASLRPLPCPVGARGAAGVRVRRCLPCGAKALQSWRAGFWPVHGKEFFAGAFCPSGNFPGAPGKRSCGAHLIAFAFRGEYPGRGIRSRPFFPFYLLFAPAKGHLPALPAASSPTIPRGERRALPAPAQGIHPLRIPFWGRQPFPPRLPSPNRRRRTAPARGPSAVYALCRRNRNETKRPCPLLVGHGCVNTEPTALAAGTAGPAGSARTRSRDSSLENPFLGTAAVSPQPPSPQRRRRQAPTRGLAAVYSHHRPARTEPQHARPLLVGRACVESEPTAPAGGTAAS